MHTFWKIVSYIFIKCWYILNFIRELIINVFLLTIIILIIYFYIPQNSSCSKSKKNALILDLNGIIVDKPIINNKFNLFSRELFGKTKHRLQENSLFNVINIIRQAKIDDNITGLIMVLKNFIGTDQTSLQYIGKVLQEFKDSGKPIYAIGDNYNQAQYFLASYANKIYLTPSGSVNLYGISTNNLYYRSLLETLKINTNVFRVGTYKSAVEPFLRDNMSDEARISESYWITKLWNNYLSTVASNRHVTKNILFPNLTTMLDKLKYANGDTAQYALQSNLIDEIVSSNNFENKMIQLFGYNKKISSFNHISMYDYQIIDKISQNNQISTIFINGIIVDGNDIPGATGGDSVACKIRNARLNHNTKAIILRINSPGGSLNAARIISEELLITKKSGKPIIVSMGGIAASGGYWISTPANVIIADKNTLTGSIGIFGIINTFEKSLDHIGIHADGVSTSPLADITISKKLPCEYIKMMQIYIDKGYTDFINLVAKHRHQTTQKIEEIAQGKVWIGSDALQNGLIDYLGDFDDAIYQAAKLAKLKNYKITWYIDEPNLLDSLLEQINIKIRYITLESIEYILKQNINRFIQTPILNTDSKLKINSPYNCYAMCSSDYKI